MARAFVVAGVGSGCGKTTVACAIVCALAERGLVVQPYKVGPDYIDPAHHSLFAGRPCRSLDCWMMGEEGVKRNFFEGLSGAQVAVVEGVGGLYDGLGTGEFASTAHVAKLLGLPVVLVVDAWGISRTAAALVRGICTFDSVRVAGVVFNFVGSPGHLRLLKRVMEENLPDVPVLGAVVRSKKGFVPERHLGILQAQELDPAERRAALLEIASQIDLEGILEVAEEVEPVASDGAVHHGGCRVAVARDRAFSFIYTENLEALEACGAEVEFFSPLAGEGIPAGARALFLPGGYPELWAQQLMDNRGFLEDLRNFVDSNLPVYAECGGLIFLSRGFEKGGKRCPMSGVLPVEVVFGGRPVLGYAEGTPTRFHPLLSGQGPVRGHVFHYSRARELGEVKRAYELFVPSKGIRQPEGYVMGSVVATYLHTNWFSDRRIPLALVSGLKGP